MQQPMYILAEGTERTHGRSAQDSNIRAGKAVAEAVRTTLGPRGMDKMLVDSSGEVVITNDGATILEEMDIEHPAAQMIVEVAETQEEEVGDGTTTAAVLTGELLAHAENLLDDDLHPTVIVEGYTEAAHIAQTAIDDMVLEADLDDDLLRKVAESSMTGKGTGDVTADVLAKHVVKAVQMAHEDGDGTFHHEDVRVLTRTGASSSATELVEGVVLDKEPINENMPRSVEDATVAVLDMKLDVREGEADTEYSINSVDQLTAAIDAEDEELRGYAEALTDAGVDVVFCTKSINDRVAGFLADAGILAFKSVKNSDARALARATGAKRLGSLTDIEDSDLGHVDAVNIRAFGDDELAFVEGGAAAKSVTLFLRGGTEHVINELERAIEDAVDVVAAAIDKGGVVPGAGATEIAIADRIRSEAAGIEGRKQLAVEAYADSVEALPRTLAENTGMDPIDALVDLRSHYEKEGIAGIISTGRSGKIGDPVEHGVIDPAAVKREAIESATEAATMIVRIDDVIAAE
ncbi:thermosome subunit [Haloferax mediterranei ATCC 33500]|nr:thermosome subunit alpha [Haloferax mediterranei]MDX5988552.1 thermosome subunit alpha [Haloferax mediterranei ATCC 33500]QCQ76611.1 thermosome subunit [Haloferax mediterranei ATCC 33500]